MCLHHSGLRDESDAAKRVARWQRIALEALSALYQVWKDELVAKRLEEVLVIVRDVSARLQGPARFREASSVKSGRPGGSAWRVSRASRSSSAWSWSSFVVKFRAHGWSVRANAASRTRSGRA